MVNGLWTGSVIMVISGIGSQFDYSILSTYRRDIPTVTEETAASEAAATSVVTDAEGQNVTAVNEEEETLAAPRLGAADAAMRAYSSDLKIDRSLISPTVDIEKSITQNAKDTALSDYTYFVGNMNIVTEDGSVTRRVAN